MNGRRANRRRNRINVSTADVRVDNGLYRVRVWLDLHADPALQALATKGMRELLVSSALSVEVEELEVEVSKNQP